MLQNCIGDLQEASHSSLHSNAMWLHWSHRLYPLTQMSSCYIVILCNNLFIVYLNFHLVENSLCLSFWQGRGGKFSLYCSIKTWRRTTSRFSEESHIQNRSKSESPSMNSGSSTSVIIHVLNHTSPKHQEHLIDFSNTVIPGGEKKIKRKGI